MVLLEETSAAASTEVVRMGKHVPRGCSCCRVRQVGAKAHRQLKALGEQLEAGEEELTIGARSFMHLGILVNPQFVKPLKKSSLPKILAALEELPSECEKRMSLLRLLGVKTTILALTSDVGFLMPMMRAMNPTELVGSLDDYLWMRSALSIVVARPDDERFESTEFLSCCLGGIILPHASTAIESKVLALLSTFDAFAEPGGGPELRARRKNWLAEVHRDIPSKQIRTLLERCLPEALVCPGLGDGWFKAGVTSFACSRSCCVVNDWSGVLALLPGIVCASLQQTSCTSCLVVAPLARVAQLVKLITGFLEYMGIKGVPVGIVSHGVAQEKLRIAVGTPDMVAPWKAQQLVLVETDVLLSLGFKQQVEQLLCIPDVQVGLHAGTRSAEVDDLVTRLLGGNEFDVPKAGVSLNYVDLYCVETGKKVASVFELWRVLGRLMNKMQLAVYCNTPESVKKLGGELEDMGVPVCLRHSDMCTEALKKAEAEFDTTRFELLVTDIFTPSSSMEVVLFELPRTPQEFVERVGRHRRRGRAKIVISIVSSDQERQLLADVAGQYQVKFEPLPVKLPQVYRRSVRRTR